MREYRLEVSGNVGERNFEEGMLSPNIAHR
jgi:hypothetical protein